MNIMNFPGFLSSYARQKSAEWRVAKPTYILTYKDIESGNFHSDSHDAIIMPPNRNCVIGVYNY